VPWIKRPGDLAPLVKRQADLLGRAIALARAGGAIVYCVCSLEPEEGEAQIAAVLRRSPDVRRLAVAPEEIGGLAECLTLSGDLRTLPCHLWGDDPRRSGLDGFFAARLVKRDERDGSPVTCRRRETGLSRADAAIRRCLQPDTGPDC